MIIKKIFSHLHLVNKHKWHVLKLCIKAGIPFRGIVHDLSKYSPIEFFESVRYYNGKKSPIVTSRLENGYSKAWLHHKGRNKHHPEYWYDIKAPEAKPIIPYKYAVEMICDRLAAGIVYNGKDWNNSTQLEYFKIHKNDDLLNEKLINFSEEIFVQVSIKGINETISSKNLKNLYKKHCL